MQANFSKMTVYFDGSCPLCRAEIAHYRGADQGGALCFIDVSEKDTCLPNGLTREQAMERFHALPCPGCRRAAALWRRGFRRCVESIAKMALGGACRGAARSHGDA